MNAATAFASVRRSSSVPGATPIAKPIVFIVDDDVSVRESLDSLIADAGWRPEVFASAQEFLDHPRQSLPSCLVLDVSLPDLDGLELQKRIADRTDLPIIFITGHGDIPMTVRAVKAGAVNFLTKPVDDEELLNAVEQCKAFREKDRLTLGTEVGSECSFEDIVGASAALQKVLEQVAIVAPTDSTVLLHGETGTGKELIARAVHNLSPRKSREMVRLNCAAIPSGLIESELFGHEKGAFTGALMQKRGRFEIADRSTLFLDEIGDISLDLQPKLLRALQEQEFERLGSTRTIQVDVRMIAATHRDLPTMIRERQFREDLFYRLNVFPIEVPPLRERREDIPLLVHYFITRGASVMKKRVGSVPPRAMDALINAPWPGNIRELENFIERCVILTPGDELVVPIDELMRSMPGAAIQVSSFHDAERRAIIAALEACSGKLAGSDGAANRLGLKRTTLQRKMGRLNISRANYHPD